MSDIMKQHDLLVSVTPDIYNYQGKTPEKLGLSSDNNWQVSQEVIDAARRIELRQAEIFMKQRNFITGEKP